MVISGAMGAFGEKKGRKAGINRLGSASHHLATGNRGKEARETCRVINGPGEIKWQRYKLF